MKKFSDAIAKEGFLQKKTFTYVFLILVFALMFMPFMTTFNDILTRVVMRFDTYKII